jgi:hypothetical protein
VVAVGVAVRVAVAVLVAVAVAPGVVVAEAVAVGVAPVAVAVLVAVVVAPPAVGVALVPVTVAEAVTVGAAPVTVAEAGRVVAVGVRVGVRVGVDVGWALTTSGSEAVVMLEPPDASAPRARLAVSGRMRRARRMRRPGRGVCRTAQSFARSLGRRSTITGCGTRASLSMPRFSIA